MYIHVHVHVLMEWTLWQVFLILCESEVVLPLAYVILTGDASLSLPPSLTQRAPVHLSSSGLVLTAWHLCSPPSRAITGRALSLSLSLQTSNWTRRCLFANLSMSPPILPPRGATISTPEERGSRVRILSPGLVQVFKRDKESLEVCRVLLVVVVSWTLSMSSLRLLPGRLLSRYIVIICTVHVFTTVCNTYMYMYSCIHVHVHVHTLCRVVVCVCVCVCVCVTVGTISWSGKWKSTWSERTISSSVSSEKLSSPKVLHTTSFSYLQPYILWLPQECTVCAHRWPALPLHPLSPLCTHTEQRYMYMYVFQADWCYVTCTCWQMSCGSTVVVSFRYACCNVRKNATSRVLDGS